MHIAFLTKSAYSSLSLGAIDTECFALVQK